LLREIEKATRSRNQNIAAAAQGADLRIDADSAEYLESAQLQILAVAARALGHLSG
jgi:anti-anti-sigma regulatory factor